MWRHLTAKTFANNLSPTHKLGLPYQTTATNPGGRRLPRASSKTHEASWLHLFELLRLTLGGERYLSSSAYMNSQTHMIGWRGCDWQWWKSMPSIPPSLTAWPIVCPKCPCIVALRCASRKRSTERWFGRIDLLLRSFWDHKVCSTARRLY